MPSSPADGMVAVKRGIVPLFLQFFANRRELASYIARQVMLRNPRAYIGGFLRDWVRL